MSKIDSNYERSDEGTSGLGPLKWHLLSLDELESRLETNLTNGLTDTRAELVLKIYGENFSGETGEPPKAWKIFFGQLRTFPFLLLFTFSLWCIIFYIIDKNDSIDLYLGTSVLCALIIWSLDKYYLEVKDYKNFLAHQRLLLSRCIVKREGAMKLIDSVYLVPGDIVLFHQGEKIPADIRILEANNLTIDESVLTGEGMPVGKTSNESKIDSMFEAQNIVFAQTYCLSGSGKGVVVETGLNTAFSRIVMMSAEAPSPIAEGISYKKCHKWLIIILIFPIAFRLLGFLLGFRFNFTLLGFIFAIDLTIVGIIPHQPIKEIATYFTSKVLVKKNVLTKQPERIRNFGENPIIIIDKTGVITENRLKIVQFWDNYEFKSPENILIDHTSNKTLSFAMTMRSAILINDAKFDHDPQSSDEIYSKPIIEWAAKGSPPDIAMIKFFQELENIEDFRDAHKPIAIEGSEFKIPFRSSYKYATAVYNGYEFGFEDISQKYIAFYKGAVEVLLEMSTKIACEDHELECKNNSKEKITQACKDCSKKGLRVIACAYKWLRESDIPKDFQPNPESVPEFLKEGLVFAGLIVLSDPPKKNVKESILSLRSLHMKCIMATGDMLLLASDVSKQTCIISNPKITSDFEEENINFYESLELTDSVIVNGNLINELRNLIPNDEVAKEKLYKILNKKEIVFGRMTPEMKLLIVEKYQEMGEKVIFVGDGMNDLPAMKRSDVSISMKKTGCSTVLDNCDVILLDDNFSSISDAFKIFEAVFDNLKKSAQHILASNLPELIPFFIFVFLELPSAFTVILIFLIDFGIDITPSIAMNYNFNLDINSRKPKDLIETQLKHNKSRFFSIVQPGLREALAGFMAYFIVMENFGFNYQTLWLMNNSKSGTMPGINDIYDPNIQTKGNSHYGLAEYENILFDYTAKAYDSYDLRVWFHELSPETWSSCYFPELDSPFTEEIICYSGEALYYAQHAWFVSVIIAKLLNFLIPKAINLGHHYHRLSKKVAFWSILLGVMLSLSLCYVPITSELLYGRPLPLLQFGFPALPSFLLLLEIDDIRALIISKNLLDITILINSVLKVNLFYNIKYGKTYDLEKTPKS
ncbi:unnamed protein product [Blepharisma stoltei]|uniref:Cation-transporting P-type ATPase N-terminal domain-containing protein n=1 Tax=Blepharisma stoltei TaxID=1481888 RepID=A0AAU9JYS8_9CILI|nr:unnamed protein product [Blepharisma stoltei]